MRRETIAPPSPQPLSHQGRGALTSPSPRGRAALTSLSPRGRGTEGEGVIAQLRFNIFSCRINRRSSLSARAQTNGMGSACISTCCDVFTLQPPNRESHRDNFPPRQHRLYVDHVVARLQRCGQRLNLHGAVFEMRDCQDNGVGFWQLIPFC